MNLSHIEKIIIQGTDSSYLRKERSPRPFAAIFETFLSEVDLDGKKVLDLGPGHFHFGELARARGATVHSVEKNPEMVALGLHKGFRVFEGDIRDVSGLTEGNRYDGVFCKYSFSALWYDDREALFGFAEQLKEVFSPDGWGWFAPWNGGARLVSDLATNLLGWQIEAFESHGFAATELTEAEAKRFGVHGFTGNRILFTKNLPVDFLSRANQSHSITQEKIVCTLREAANISEKRRSPSTRHFRRTSKLAWAALRRFANALLRRATS